MFVGLSQSQIIFESLEQVLNNTQIWIELIKIVPDFLWFLLLAIFFLIYKPILQDILPNIRTFKAMGVEFSMVQDSITAALELAEKNPQWKIEVSPDDKRHVLKRAKEHLKVFKDTQILWVDDHPENNLNERKMFRQLKIEVDIAEDTEKAIKMLKNASYNIVISDMHRNNELPPGKKETAGLTFLQKFREINKNTPVIFYIGIIKPDLGVPACAFGLTNRPDELLHLVLDALERKKY